MVFSWHMPDCIITKERAGKGPLQIALCIRGSLIPGGVAPQQSSVALRLHSKVMHIHRKGKIAIEKTACKLTHRAIYSNPNALENF